ncbi:PAS domain-containing sensor histidine kinase [Psychroserpens sp. NJDZ02]|uniref:PAS domain-containing sensor histidine kinase n=1 Tax=Psychroserpens sp. NJDZ02 TaxID=2570561 RepID=UPI0010A8FA42|nr:PAS domain-containing sensor histidine kinase [Psychroserpens sp. NJDZ02]QCE41519.1 PAS domain S-box protein [Psychroserpens sp. NJDZ02]
MSQNQIEVLQRALLRERTARKAAEKILEDKSRELYEANQKLEATNTQLETSLTNADSQLQGVFENIVDAYVITDLWGNILKMNDSAVKLLGFKDVNVDFNLLEMLDITEQDKVQSWFEGMKKQGTSTDFHVNITTVANQKKLVHINSSLIYDDGVAVAVQGIVRDITVDNKYKKSIEAERLKYSNIIANMNLGLIEINKAGEILMINHSFSELSGYKEEELIGKQGAVIFPFDSKGVELIEEERRKRVNGESNSYELQIKTKTGEARYWLVSGAPNLNLEGEQIGSIAVALDITDFKNLQNQKEKLLSKLEKSNDELQEYAHIVSHDLKSPLRSINALVSWLKEDNQGKLDDVSLQNFGLIETTLEKMEQLITDVLNYSSVGADNSVKVNVDLNSMVSELVSMLYIPDYIEIKSLNILPNIKGDKTKLQQVFQNLISNSVKFIDKEKGSIVIDVEDLKSHYKFSIKDNGIGIDKKYHDKIFKIFHSLKKSKDSSGIGLSIVKKIVNLHEGEIWLDSEPNVGTTFYFTLKK